MGKNGFHITEKNRVCFVRDSDVVFSICVCVYKYIAMDVRSWNEVDSRKKFYFIRYTEILSCGHIIFSSSIEARSRNRCKF